MPEEYAIYGSAPSHFRLEPTNDAPVEFDGNLIGRWSDPATSGKQTREHAVSLYRSSKGPFIAEIVFTSSVKNENRCVTILIGDNLEAVRSGLMAYDPAERAHFPPIDESSPAAKTRFNRDHATRRDLREAWSRLVGVALKGCGLVRRV